MNEGFSGMSALIADLHRMGEAVVHDAAPIVSNAGELMKSEVIQSYPVREGKLRSGVTLEEFGDLRVKVSSKAAHAHLYEYGTVQRFTASTGANRGTMPAKPTFVPAAVRHRRRMVDALIALMKRQTVRGMAGAMELRES